jgi:hypothetical protein
MEMKLELVLIPVSDPGGNQEIHPGQERQADGQDAEGRE